MYPRIRKKYVSFFRAELEALVRGTQRVRRAQRVVPSWTPPWWIGGYLRGGLSGTLCVCDVLDAETNPPSAIHRLVAIERGQRPPLSRHVTVGTTIARTGIAT